jgi:hypothetical protein
MAFTLPVFNLPVDIYSGPWLTRSLRLAGVLGNLAFGKRVEELFGSFGPAATSPAGQLSILLLPPLTDIRSTIQVAQPDLIEIPSGSGRWYQAMSVEDIGKGFSNEHRMAFVGQVSHFIDPVFFAGLNWPVPMT